RVGTGRPAEAGGPTTMSAVGCRPVTRRTRRRSAMPHTLPSLPYAFDALEPHIDAKTMEIHHGKHHKAYVDNLNKALESAPADVQNMDIVTLLRSIKKVPEGIRQAVINNGGGHHNHSLFWEIMGPGGGGEPSGAVGDAIKAAFGDFAKFKDA